MKHGFSSAQIRRQPKAEAIAEAIKANAAILNLRTPRIVRDIQERFGVHSDTALAAITLARLA